MHFNQCSKGRFEIFIISQNSRTCSTKDHIFVRRPRMLQAKVHKFTYLHIINIHFTIVLDCICIGICVVHRVS